MKILTERIRVEKEITICVNDISKSLIKNNRVLKVISEDNQSINTNPFSIEDYASDITEEELYNMRRNFNIRSKKANFNEEKITKQIYYTLLKSDDDDLKASCYDKIVENNQSHLKSFEELFPYIPKLSDKCNHKNMIDIHCSDKQCVKTFWDESCKLNLVLPYLEDFMASISYNIESQNITHKLDFLDKEKVFEFIHKYQLQKDNEKFTDWSFSKIATSLETMEHPDLTTRLYYINTFKTDAKYDFKFNPYDITNKNQFIDEHYSDSEYTSYTGGDGTVPNSSAIVPFLKWSLNKKYSTEIVQMCSNGKFNNTNKEMKVTYKGIECGCSTASKEACSHSGIITDKAFINEFQENNLMNSNNDNIEERLESTKEYILNIKKYICSNLKSWEDYNNEKN